MPAAARQRPRLPDVAKMRGSESAAAAPVPQRQPDKVPAIFNLAANIRR